MSRALAHRVPGIVTADPLVYSGPIPGTNEAGWSEPKLLREPVTSFMRRAIHHGQELDLWIWRMGGCNIFVAVKPEGIHGEMRWHLSISRADRHPSWDEIKTARYRLLPHDRAFAMILPPPPFYVNVPEQDHVFHLHEIEDEARPWETL